MRLPTTDRRRVVLETIPSTIGLVAFLAGVWLFTGDAFFSTSTGVGLVLAGVATLLAVTLPWAALSPSSTAVVPTLNLLALAVVAAGGLRVALLALIPALVLACAHGTRGAIAGTVLGCTVAWIDLVIAWEPVGQQDLPRLLLLPLTLATLSFAMASMARSAQARSALHSRQDTEVRLLLDEQMMEQTLLEQVLASLPAGVLVLNERGMVVMYNPQFARLVGQSPNTEAEASSELLASVLELARSGRSVSAPTRWWTSAGGTRRALRSTVVQVGSTQGMDAHSVVLVEDLTEVEAALAQREDFVAAVSHELRNPLTSVVGYLDLLREEDGRTDRGANLIDVAERNSHRMLRLVEDLLVASSLTRGPVNLMPRQVDLRGVVREGLEAVAVVATAGHITLEDVTQGQWSVTGDSDRLVQVLVNVLHNAINYSKPGGTVRVDLEAAGEQVCLSVTDQGIGMLQEEADRAFERFFRAPSVLRSSRHGTGLGLHVSREIVLSHGGEMFLESKPGCGTRVEIVLPARLKPAGAAA